MFDETAIKLGMLFIAFSGLIITFAINREKLHWARLKVAVMNNAFKANYRSNQILDFQINLRIQAINGKISLRKTTLIYQEGAFNKKNLEVFNKAVNIKGDLTKYSEDDFAQFMSCLLIGYDCSKILEYESRFRDFIQLEDLFLEKYTPRPITLLGRIAAYQTEREYFLEFDYDVNGSRRKLLQKLEFKPFLSEI